MASGRSRRERSTRSATRGACRGARRWWPGKLRRSAARRGRSGRGAGTPFDTRSIGVHVARSAGAAPRSASRRPPRRETSTRLPKSSARGCPPTAAAAAGTSSRSRRCHERAICCRTEENGPADRGGKGPGLRTLDQSEDAAAEAGAHDACAVTPGDAPCPFDECVHGWSRDFEIVAKTFVRLLQQPPELIEVAPPQRIDKRMNARDLGVHVATPFGIDGLGLTPPLVLCGRSQRAMLAGIDNRNRQLVWKWDLLILERRAIEQQRVAAPP